MILENITQLTIYEAEKIKNIFLSALNSENELTIDMQMIEKIDLVGIQLLISMFKSARAMDKKIKLTNIASNISNQIKICNCDIYLGIENE